MPPPGVRIIEIGSSPDSSPERLLTRAPEVGHRQLQALIAQQRALASKLLTPAPSRSLQSSTSAMYIAEPRQDPPLRLGRGNDDIKKSIQKWPKKREAVYTPGAKVHCLVSLQWLTDECLNAAGDRKWSPPSTSIIPSMVFD